jgi:hypothetical protein
MTVKDFVNSLVEPNTLIRLWYKVPKGEKGHHEEVIHGDKPMMEHQLVKGEYADKNVIGITDIFYRHSPYVEAVNLVIER